MNIWKTPFLSPVWQTKPPIPILKWMATRDKCRHDAVASASQVCWTKNLA